METANLRFFTVNDVADVLKMHPQVISRKLASGIMEGYKIGKDWRISERQLLEFLEQHSNRKPLDPDAAVIGAFFVGGKLSSIPTTRKKRLVILKHLVAKLEPNRVYSEPEINEFLRPFHSDICTLRRELIINKLMVRKTGKYKVVTWQT